MSQFDLSWSLLTLEANFILDVTFDDFDPLFTGTSSQLTLKFNLPVMLHSLVQ